MFSLLLPCVLFGAVSIKNYLCGVSSPHDESLLFRQKEPKPFSPVRGPSEPAEKQALRDASASAPNQDGSGTRFAQTAFAERSIRDSSSATHEGGELTTLLYRSRGIFLSPPPCGFLSFKCRLQGGGLSIT